MKCPTCGGAENWVVYLRVAEDGALRRRRECRTCKKRWFTVEAAEAVYQRAAGVVEKFQELKRAVGED
jgi:transcriptional repressor NrdR